MCDYCKILKYKLTPASPRKQYKFCPMCGECLTEAKVITLEELQLRINKPIYVVNNQDGFNGWAICKEIGNIITTLAGANSMQTKTYRDTWFAYDHEPRKETKHED